MMGNIGSGTGVDWDRWMDPSKRARVSGAGAGHEKSQDAVCEEVESVDREDVERGLYCVVSQVVRDVPVCTYPSPGVAHPCNRAEALCPSLSRSSSSGPKPGPKCGRQSPMDQE